MREKVLSRLYEVYCSSPGWYTGTQEQSERLLKWLDTGRREEETAAKLAAYEYTVFVSSNQYVSGFYVREIGVYIGGR